MQITSAFYNTNNEIYNKTSSNSSSKQDLQKQDSNANSQSQNTQTQMVNGVELDAKELQVLRELQSTDRNVKAHEAAHQAAGGGLTGPASFSYTRGPDNQMYAVAGEVPIRMQSGNTPEESISIARRIVSAAMAPANPSPQDYKVAANAVKMEIEARAEAMKIKAEEAQKSSKNDANLGANSSEDSSGVNSDTISQSTETSSNAQKASNSNTGQESLSTNNEFKAFVAGIYKQNSNSLGFNFTLNIAS